MRKLVLLLSVLACGVVGCHTSGRFQVPEGTNVYVDNRSEPLVLTPDGRTRTRPFGYGASSGVPYRLEKDGAMIQQGTLASDFRFTSIFWPPLAFLYWPLGFKEGVTFDLTKPPQQAPRLVASQAPPATRPAK